MAKGDPLLEDVNRATMANMPDGTSGYVLTAKGPGVDPAYEPAPAPVLSDLAPVTQAEGDAPSPGIGAEASRYDHRHGMPATYTPSAHAHDAAEITSGRFGMARMPDMELNKVMVGQGVGVSPVEKPYGMGALYAFNGIFLHEYFPSLDNWDQSVSGSGSVTFSVDWGTVWLDTGTTLDSYARITRNFRYPRASPTWDKNRRLKARIYFYAVYATGANDLIGITLGNLITPTNNHIGFKVLGGTLYGTVANGTAESTLSIQTVATGDILLLEAVLTAGTGCEFFVNGVLRGTLTTNLPAGTTLASQIDFWLNNASSAARLFIMTSELLFLQGE